MTSPRSWLAFALPAAVFLAAGAAVCAEPPASEAESRAETQTLIQALESGDFDRRAQAASRLQAQGERARDALEKARRESQSAETRESLGRVLGRLNRAELVLEAVDRDGQPAAGVDVEIRIAPDESQIGAVNPELKTTDAAGQAAFGGLTPGTATLYTVWQQRTVLDSTVPMYGAFRLNPGRNLLRYVLPKFCALKGRAVSARSGAPVPSARVFAIRDTGREIRGEDLDVHSEQANPLQNEETFEGTGDLEGGFVIEKLPGEGRYLVFVQHEEHTTALAGPVEVGSAGPTVLHDPVKLTPKAEAMGSLKVRLNDVMQVALKNEDVQVELQRVLGQDAQAQLEAMRRGLPYLMYYNSRYPDYLKSDENGYLEFKSLPAGTYKLAVRAYRNYRHPLVCTNLKVVAGQASVVDDPQCSTGARLSGRVTDSKGRGLRDFKVFAMPWDDAECATVLSDLSAWQAWFIQYRQQYGIQPVGDGRYAIDGLAPGKYSIAFLHGNCLVGLMHGIEVQDGAAAEVKDFKLPPAFDPVRLRAAGRVRLSDGTPLHDVLVGDSTKTNAYGAFRIDLENAGSRPTVLHVRNPGYFPEAIDLKQPGLNPNNLDIVLRPMRYGSLAVTVRDEKGAPIAGAKISAGIQNTYSVYGRKVHRWTTDASGRVLLSGIAPGKRQLHVSADGYYLDKPLDIAVAPATEASCTVQLRRGLPLKGRVEVPPGADPRRVLIALQEYRHNFSPRVCAVDAQGRFTAEGLAPGKYSPKAGCPGLAEMPRPPFDLNERSEELLVRMVAPGGIKLDLGPAWRDRTLSLARPGSWNPVNNNNTGTPGAPDALAGSEMAVCSAGKAECFGVAPGTYDLLAAKSNPFDGWYTYFAAARRVAATTVVRGVSVAELPGNYAEFLKMPRQTLRLPEAGGNVRGRIAIKNAGDLPDEVLKSGSLCLTVCGEQAFAVLQFNDIPAAKDALRVPVVSGTTPPPTGVGPASPPAETIQMAGPNTFIVSGLPAGEYTLYARMAGPTQPGQEWSPTTGYNATRSKDVVVRKFSVPAVAPASLPAGVAPASLPAGQGQTLDLGEVTLEIPAEVRALLRAPETPELIGDDKLPLFTP